MVSLIPDDLTSCAGVHGPWVGGIHGGGTTGAYSIVLSGGYEGDIDDGDEFTYTGGACKW